MARLKHLKLLPVLFLGLLMAGCATTRSPSLYIPPSDSKIRTFEKPPATVIRLPVTFTLPRWSVLAKIPRLGNLSNFISEFLQQSV